MIKYKVYYFSVIFLVILLIFQFFNLSVINKLSWLNSKDEIRLSGEKIYREQWIKNPGFTSHQDWYSSKQGDETDTDATIGSGQANFKVIGDLKSFELFGNPFNPSNWKNSTNLDLPVLPDNSTIDQQGVYVDHKWDGPTEQLENNPSVHFKQSITMPVNMSDFIITSASIQAVANATVTVSPINGGIEREGDSAQYLRGDFIRFYILISDVKNVNSYPIAEYKTTELGKDGPPAIDKLNDTYLIPVPEEILISYLSSIFKADNYNFTITLGIDIFCEDNLGGVDRDYWNEIRIKNLNFTFSYKKKIDQFTTVSWNHDGDKISSLSENKIVVEEAVLQFIYKLDSEWPTLLSPNSEIRILINNNLHTEIIKLSSATTTFQEAQIGGFDVIPLITDDVNLSIQIFLADTFGLDRNITISIDNVNLEIAYIEIFSSSILEQEPWIFSVLLIFVSVGTVSLGGYLIAYQRILKYPKPVRKVKKYRRSLKKKKKPKIHIDTRENLFNNIYKRELNKFSGDLKGKYFEEKLELKNNFKFK